jgi:1-acyl-sn-glycerol-3-phosphate acyltransferase
MPFWGLKLNKIFDYIKFAFQVVILITDIISESLFMILIYFCCPRKYNFARHYRRWGKRVLSICGVKLKIFGEENINPDETYIYASNHTSQFDIPIIFSAIKQKVAIIYKKELEKVPFFGWMLNRSYFISIDRNDARKAMESVLEALRQIKEGVGIIIYPEGTRSPDGSVREFKRGTFILAAKSGKPVIPVTIVGSNNIMPKGSLFFKSSEVQVIFHSAVIFPKGMSKEEEIEKMEEIRRTIISGFDKAKKHLAIS